MQPLTSPELVNAPLVLSIMKAWILNIPAPVNEYPLHLSEIAVPTPSDDELVIRVAACGICRTDPHVVEGDLPVRRSPVIPGHQIVGSVAAFGSRVEGFDIGDRVGSTAETVSRTAPCSVLITHPQEREWIGFSTGEIDLIFSVCSSVQIPIAFYDKLPARCWSRVRQRQEWLN